MLDCVILFPSAMHYLQYKGIFARGHGINHDPVMVGSVKFLPHSCLTVQMQKIKLPQLQVEVLLLKHH